MAKDKFAAPDVDKTLAKMPSSRGKSGLTPASEDVLAAAEAKRIAAENKKIATEKWQADLEAFKRTKAEREADFEARYGKVDTLDKIAKSLADDFQRLIVRTAAVAAKCDYSRKPKVEKIVDGLGKLQGELNSVVAAAHVASLFDKERPSDVPRLEQYLTMDRQGNYVLTRRALGVPSKLDEDERYDADECDGPDDLDEAPEEDEE